MCLLYQIFIKNAIEKQNVFQLNPFILQRLKPLFGALVSEQLKVRLITNKALFSLHH
jgi:hypothetical protein